VERAIRNLGGIASTAEILQCGNETDMIRWVAQYGKIASIRRGWYATPDVPADSLRAWRAGGRLTCISAAVHYGLWPHETKALHVRVAANASRVERSPDIVLHWSRGPMTGTRLAVSIDEALATIRRCQGPEVFHAVRRAANR
jgi:hypothetical protein